MRRALSSMASLGVAGALVLGGCGSGPDAPFAGTPLDPVYTVPDVDLVDTEGDDFSLATDTDKRLTLVFFGYTYCPDVCPTTLSIMTQALDQLGPLAAKVTPVFVTVDPERDTVAQLKAYQEHFHPSFVMLTGSPERVREAARAYRVYHRKVESESATDYLMDHSSITFLMGPDGGYVTHFGHDATAETMAATLRQKLGG